VHVTFDDPCTKLAAISANANALSMLNTGSASASARRGIGYDASLGEHVVNIVGGI
jgi:hypothetical protein